MSTQPPTVTRTYRAALRLGEDFLTLEETITLPLEASDDEVQQAVALGWRIYAAQHESVAAQAAQVRADAPPAAPTAKPASDKQRAFIDTLAREAGWDTDALTAFAAERGVPRWDAMTNTQAAALIDAIKAHKAAQEQERQAPARPDLPPVGDRIRDPDAPPTEAQLTKITRSIARLDDAALQQIASRIAAVLGYQRVSLTGLRDPQTWPGMAQAEPAHRLNKGRASQIIALLDMVETISKTAA